MNNQKSYLIKEDEFNLFSNDPKETFGSFENTNWSKLQLEMFDKLEQIKHNIIIQIYDVYLNELNEVGAIGFRVTAPNGFDREYPTIYFQKDGTINKDDIREQINMLKIDSPESFKILKNFYKALID